MSRRRIDRSRARTYPIRERTHKVRLEHLGTLPKDSSVAALIEAMPDLLAAGALRDFINAVVAAHRKR